MKEKFGFRTQKTPPQNTNLTQFEEDLYNMIVNVKFRRTNSEFQTKLDKDIKKIKSCKSLIVPGDKTTNFYEVRKDQYKKMMVDSLTTQYCKAGDNVLDKNNEKAATLARAVEIDDRTQCFSTEKCFLTLKDHKDNFNDKPTTRLINPAKTDIGKISKKLLDKVNTSIKSKTDLNQWRNTAEVLKWFHDVDKTKAKFIQFDIESYYPSITEQLLMKSIQFAKKHTNISDIEIDMIIHAKRSLLFTQGIGTWQKKSGTFDVTMGSYDGAETCEIVGLYLLDKLKEIIPQSNVGLYRDDGLAIITHSNGPKIDKIRKRLHQLFKQEGLKIEVECNKDVVNFLDVTLDINSNCFQPYKKPNNSIQYIHNQSNHPQCIKNNIPIMVNRRLVQLSSSEEVFDSAKKDYEEALSRSGYKPELTYDRFEKDAKNSDGNSQQLESTETNRRKRTRKRNVTWFNPPFSQNVETNIGRKFLSLIDKHFPKNNTYHKLFNRNNLKISYSCMPNIGQVIKNHNKSIMDKNEPELSQKQCNCREKTACPLQNKCLTECVVYKAQVTSGNETSTYIGLTEGTFKKRFTGHKSTFSNEKLRLSSELSKKIWSLKDDGKQYNITWDIVKRTNPRKAGKNTCDLCNTEKLAIIQEIRRKNTHLLNKRSEIVSKCRHVNKFLLKSF